MIFVFPMFTQRTFLSISAFQVLQVVLPWTHKSSAYSRTQGQPKRNSLDKAYSTIMKSSGLRTEPRRTPTLTPNSSLYPLPSLTLLLMILYMNWTRRTSHSSILSFAFATRLQPSGIDQLLSSDQRRLVSAQVLFLYLINTSIS